MLGALVTHVGSGISFEVNSALETMVFLASKYSQELVRFSYHINGISIYHPLICLLFTKVVGGKIACMILRSFSFYHSGILDYLEAFSNENLHKVNLASLFGLHFKSSP